MNINQCIKELYSTSAKLIYRYRTIHIWPVAQRDHLRNILTLLARFRSWSEIILPWVLELAHVVPWLSDSAMVLHNRTGLPYRIGRLKEKTEPWHRIKIIPQAKVILRSSYYLKGHLQRIFK